MYLQSETNIIISGKASSGTSVTALFLAYLLNKKYIYAGGVLKFFAEELGYDPKSSDIVDFEKKYGEKWDILWENYIVWKIENTRNLLIDAKIAGFFVNQEPWLFEVFVLPSIEARIERAGYDKRTEDIHQRDLEHASRWKKLFGVDILDVEQIRENYDFIIDNSDMTISETVYKIYKVMREALGLKDILLMSDIEKLEAVYQVKGKGFLLEKIRDKGNLVNINEIFSDWKKHFKSDLDNTSPEWREIVNS